MKWLGLERNDIRKAKQIPLVCKAICMMALFDVIMLIRTIVV